MLGKKGEEGDEHCPYMAKNVKIEKWRKSDKKTGNIEDFFWKI